MVSGRRKSDTLQRRQGDAVHRSSCGWPRRRGDDYHAALTSKPKEPVEVFTEECFDEFDKRERPLTAREMRRPDPLGFGSSGPPSR